MPRVQEIRFTPAVHQPREYTKLLQQLSTDNLKIFDKKKPKSFFPRTLTPGEEEL
jgi:hypothetical protein